MKSTMTTRCDFSCTFHGMIALLQPLTPAAHEWCDEHLPEDTPTLGNAYAVGSRYIDDILVGIGQDGLLAL